MTNEELQTLIDKQVWLVTKLQKQDYLEKDTKERSEALAAAIAGLRDLDTIAKRQQPTIAIDQDVRDYIANRATTDSRAAQLLKRLVESGLEKEARS
jgi:hypothetical protein